MNFPGGVIARSGPIFPVTEILAMRQFGIEREKCGYDDLDFDWRSRAFDQ